MTEDQETSNYAFVHEVRYIFGRLGAVCVASAYIVPPEPPAVLSSATS